jgi:hypothetical protein
MTATIDVNVFARPQQPPQQPPQQLLEPSLMNLLGQLSAGAGRDDGMVNAIQNVLRQFGGILAGELTGNSFFSCSKMIFIENHSPSFFVIVRRHHCRLSLTKKLGFCTGQEYPFLLSEAPP